MKTKLSFLLVLMLLVQVSWAQAQNVKGKVVDASNEPIVGATVVVKGTTNGTATDVDGNFTVNAASDATLVVSFIGYLTEEVAVNGRSSINVTLAEDLKQLGEVVVIGYGAQRKEAVTGSVEHVSDDIIKEVASADVSRSLQGRIAGVVMNQSSSKPGSAMNITIRGTKSFSADNAPLVVVDGIPTSLSLSDINPGDIKSIDILKDASSCAIYGSRGVGGVIVVTTNSGNFNQKAIVAYNGYVGANTVFAKYPMMNGKQLVELRQIAGKYQNGPDEDDENDTDWQDLLYAPGLVTNHDLSVRGGSEKSNYTLSTGYYREEAVLPCQNYSRLNARLAIDQKVGDWLRFSLQSFNGYSVKEGMGLGLYGVLSASPLVDPKNEDGTTKRDFQTAADQGYTITRDVVEDLVANDQWLDESKSFHSNNTGVVEVNIPKIEGLKYRMNIGLDFAVTNTGGYTAQGVWNYSRTTAASASTNYSINNKWSVENLLTYDRTFGNHKIGALALYSAEKTHYHNTYSATTATASDKFLYYNLGSSSEPKNVSGGMNETGLLSYMGRILYSYDDRYMLNISYRADGSSRLAEGNKWHAYPAVSLGWNIHKEAFMANTETWLNNLKFRLGWGQTSNQAVSPYTTYGSLATVKYNFGDQLVQGYYPTETSNPNLGWEFTKGINVGLEFGLFKDRLTGNFEYYNLDTEDNLQAVSLPTTSGFSSYTANVGKINNKGFELSLNGVLVEDFNGLKWEAGFNIYSNKNEIIALASGKKQDEGNYWFVGHSMNVLYDYEYVGLWSQKDVDSGVLAILDNAAEPGDIRVKYTGEYDDNGMPVRKIGSADRVITDMDPKAQGGFNTKLTYKGFDLSVVGIYQVGGKLVSTLHSSFGYLNMLNGRRGNVDVDYWTPENTNARYPNPAGLKSGDNPKYGSTLGIFDAGYCKVRDITLGYSFDSMDGVKKLGINKLRLYATVQNPFVISSKYHKETGLDPETNSRGNENVATAASGYSNRTYTIATNTPQTRRFLVGLNLTF